MPNTKKTGPKKKRKGALKSASRPSKKVEAREALPGEETAEAKQRPKKSTPQAQKRNPLLSGTYFAKQNEFVRWRLVDASGQHLGRLSSAIATMLMGKDKPVYTRFADTGDHVVVINAKQVVLTGNKWRDKIYQYHTNYPGGLKTFSARQLLENHPERLIEMAVWRMLPHGHMGRRWYKKLRVYVGAEHPHTAQKPEPVKLQNLGPSER